MISQIGALFCGEMRLGRPPGEQSFARSKETKACRNSPRKRNPCRGESCLPAVIFSLPGRKGSDTLAECPFCRSN